MPGTLFLVHSGHKTCAGQIIAQVLLIGAVGRKGENGRVDRYPRFGSIVWALGPIEHCSNSATLT